MTKLVYNFLTLLLIKLYKVTNDQKNQKYPFRNYNEPPTKLKINCEIMKILKTFCFIHFYLLIKHFKTHSFSED